MRMTAEPQLARAGDIEALEIELLLEAMLRHHGYDFRGYAPASLRRRLRGIAADWGEQSIAGLVERVLHDPGAGERLVHGVTVDVSSMFRDPPFWRALRALLAPLLAGESAPRIWHAGCGSGEEVYSMAILLEEEGFGSRARIYATDLSGLALGRAKEGVFPLARMKEFTRNYQRAGGKVDFSDYYSAKHERAILGRGLARRVVWGQHNLVSDASFNEFHLILVRNVLIYFGRELQARVHRVIYASLAPLGLLGLGRSETVEFSPHEGDYVQAVEGQKLYRRIR